MSNGNNNGHHSNGTGNGLVHVNGHKPDAAIVSEHELLWDGLSPAVTNALGQPLDPALVSQRKGAEAGSSTTSKATPSSTKPIASSATAGGAMSWLET